jgi:hypothetical protein
MLSDILDNIDNLLIDLSQQLESLTEYFTEKGPVFKFNRRIAVQKNVIESFIPTIDKLYENTYEIKLDERLNSLQEALLTIKNHPEYDNKIKLCLELLSNITIQIIESVCWSFDDKNIRKRVGKIINSYERGLLTIKNHLKYETYLDTFTNHYKNLVNEIIDNYRNSESSTIKDNDNDIEKINKKEKEISSSSEEVEELKEKIILITEHYTNEINNLNEKFSSNKDKLEELRKDYQIYKEDANEKSRQLVELRKELNIEKMKNEELEKLKLDKIHLEKKIDELKNDLSNKAQTTLNIDKENKDLVSVEKIDNDLTNMRDRANDSNTIKNISRENLKKKIASLNATISSKIEQDTNDGKRKLVLPPSVTLRKKLEVKQTTNQNDGEDEKNKKEDDEPSIDINMENKNKPPIDKNNRRKQPEDIKLFYKDKNPLAYKLLFDSDMIIFETAIDRHNQLVRLHNLKGLTKKEEKEFNAMAEKINKYVELNKQKIEYAEKQKQIINKNKEEIEEEVQDLSEEEIVDEDEIINNIQYEDIVDEVHEEGESDDEEIESDEEIEQVQDLSEEIDEDEKNRIRNLLKKVKKNNV